MRAKGEPGWQVWTEDEGAAVYVKTPNDNKEWLPEEIEAFGFMLRRALAEVKAHVAKEETK